MGKLGLKQSAYGPHISDYSTQYNKYIAHALDRIGLRLSLSQADTTEVGDLFLFIMNNFFSDRFVSMSMFNGKYFWKTAPEHQGDVANHFRDYLLICADVLNNEVDIPYAINSIINSQINTKCKQYIDDNSYYKEYAINLMNKISDLLLGEEDKTVTEKNKQELFDLIFVIIPNKNLIEHFLMSIEDHRRRPRRQVSLLPFTSYKHQDLKLDIWEKLEAQMVSLDINYYQSSLTKRLLDKFVNQSLFGSLKNIDSFIRSISPPNSQITLAFKRLLVIIRLKFDSEVLSADKKILEIFQNHQLSDFKMQQEIAIIKPKTSGLSKTQEKLLEKKKAKKATFLAQFPDELEEDNKSTSQPNIDQNEKYPNQKGIVERLDESLDLSIAEAEATEYIPAYIMFDNVASVYSVGDERSLQTHEAR